MPIKSLGSMLIVGIHITQTFFSFSFCFSATSRQHIGRGLPLLGVWFVSTTYFVFVYFCCLFEDLELRVIFLQVTVQMNDPIIFLNVLQITFNSNSFEMRRMLSSVYLKFKLIFIRETVMSLFLLGLFIVIS